MAYGTSDSNSRTGDGTARYRQYLVGYLAVTVITTALLLYLAKHSTVVMAGIEVVAGVTVLGLLSLVAIPALYLDAAGLDDSEAAWTTNEKQYVGFAVGAPAVVYLAIAYVTTMNVALVVAAVALVIATVESSAVYLYNRYRQVGQLA
jgi:hypothetical protein